MGRTLRLLTATGILGASLLSGYGLLAGQGPAATANQAATPAGNTTAPANTSPPGNTAPTGNTTAPGNGVEPAGHRIGLIMGMPSAIGQIVTDDYMFTLYRYDGDTAEPSTSRCTDACSRDWLPALVEDQTSKDGKGGQDVNVTFDGGDRSLVGTLVRPDGSRQLTLKGWPLYRYTGDVAEVDTKGQGVDGRWSAVTVTGDKI